MKKVFAVIATITTFCMMTASVLVEEQPVSMENAVTTANVPLPPDMENMTPEQLANYIDNKILQNAVRASSVTSQNINIEDAQIQFVNTDIFYGMSDEEIAAFIDKKISDSADNTMIEENPQMRGNAAPTQFHDLSFGAYSGSGEYTTDALYTNKNFSCNLNNQLYMEISG